MNVSAVFPPRTMFRLSLNHRSLGTDLFKVVRTAVASQRELLLRQFKIMYEKSNPMPALISITRFGCMQMWLVSQVRIMILVFLGPRMH
jgi:hypothetical protein